MASHSPSLVLSPFARPFVVADYMGAMALCCTYAHDAASEGRHLAAHGLFQNALSYFERANQIVAREEDSSFHDWAAIDKAKSALVVARGQLDECATYIYSDAVGEVIPPITEHKVR